VYFCSKRLPRAAATQESSRLNQKIFHLLDGPEQRARDDAMRAAMAAELEGRPIPDGNPNQWADRSKNHIQFDYDAYAEVERWWTGGGREQIEALGGHSDGAHDSSVEMAMKSRL
jgi:salicylate hydroxylase